MHALVIGLRMGAARAGVVTTGWFVADGCFERGCSTVFEAYDTFIGGVVAEEGFEPPTHGL